MDKSKKSNLLVIESVYVFNPAYILTILAIYLIMSGCYFFIFEQLR